MDTYEGADEELVAEDDQDEEMGSDDSDGENEMVVLDPDHVRNILYTNNLI